MNNNIEIKTGYELRVYDIELVSMDETPCFIHASVDLSRYDDISETAWDTVMRELWERFNRCGYYQNMIVQTDMVYDDDTIVRFKWEYDGALRSFEQTFFKLVKR